ncbi:MAG: IPT/TIG domain-containing protein [Holophaga sp.]|nr:IPT/TIG domain-containing protein [Holophaga sp.]
MAVVSGLCLAAALGCAGKTHYTVPDVAAFSPAQGAVGSTVTITGKDFSDIYSVSFGGQPTTAFHVNNSNSLTVTVPPTAATGPLVVENPAGQGTSYTSFVVTPQICAVTITGTSSYTYGLSTTSGAVGSTFTVTGYGLNDTISVTIGAESCPVFTVVNANKVVVTVGPSAVTGPVVLTVPGLNSTTLTASTDPENFTVTS